MLDEVSEGVIEVAGLLSEGVRGIEEFYVNACGTEFGQALTADEWVGIDGGNYAACDARGYECVGARTSAAVVGAGFEGDVGCCAFHVVAKRGCLFEGDDLGVIARVVVMGAFADDQVVAGEDTAYGWVRAGEGCGFTREGDRAV